MSKALVVGHESALVVLVSAFLQRRGYVTQTTKALEPAGTLEPTLKLCVIDLDLPSGEGDRLARLAMARGTPVVLMTSSRAIPEHRRGDRLRSIVKPVTEAKLDDALRQLEVQTDDCKPEAIIGASPEIQSLTATIARVGPTDATTLIVGESGTGKELVASALHAASHRSTQIYLALNCGAVTPTLIESELFGHEKGSFTGAVRRHTGYFERAHRGTLFLDEITEMPLELQVRLLRVLESRIVARVGSSEVLPVDVRVIAATNIDPWEAVRKRKLREDLLYRLHIVPIYVPPLRARAGDISLLAEHFLAQLNRSGRSSKSLTEGALARLEAYAWPGNVRELGNIIERAYILSDSDVINEDSVRIEYPRARADATPAPHRPATATLAEAERRLIEETLQHCRTKEEAARALGVSSKTLYNKLRSYAQDRPYASGNRSAFASAPARASSRVVRSDARD